MKYKPPMFGGFPQRGRIPPGTLGTQSPTQPVPVSPQMGLPANPKPQFGAMPAGLQPLPPVTAGFQPTTPAMASQPAVPSQPLPPVTPPSPFAGEINPFWVDPTAAYQPGVNFNTQLPGIPQHMSRPSQYPGLTGQPGSPFSVNQGMTGDLLKKLMAYRHPGVVQAAQAAQAANAAQAAQPAQPDWYTSVDEYDWVNDPSNYGS